MLSHEKNLFKIEISPFRCTDYLKNELYETVIENFKGSFFETSSHLKVEQKKIKEISQENHFYFDLYSTFFTV